MKRALVVMLFTWSLVGCSGAASPIDGGLTDAPLADGEVPTFAMCPNPSWLRDLIATYEGRSPGNPAYSITRYTYGGMTVFYLPAQCCDQLSALLDACGEPICAPDGGFGGGGDGGCPDFFDTRSDEAPIWSDPRGA
jgi:hypothetical protein